MTKHRGSAATIAVAATLLLSACQAAPPPARGQSPAPTVVGGTDSSPVPRAAPAPSVRRAGDLPEPHPNATQILERRLAALGIDRIERADDLVGRTAAQIESLLGEADLARREEPAEMWQYVSEGCVLNLFLYPRDGGQRIVDHAELRSRDSTASEVGEPCLQDLLAGRLAAAG